MLVIFLYFQLDWQIWSASLEVTLGCEGQRLVLTGLDRLELVCGPHSNNSFYLVSHKRAHMVHYFVIVYISEFSFTELFLLTGSEYKSGIKTRSSSPIYHSNECGRTRKANLKCFTKCLLFVPEGGTMCKHAARGDDNDIVGHSAAGSSSSIHINFTRCCKNKQ